MANIRPVTEGLEAATTDVIKMLTEQGNIVHAKLVGQLLEGMRHNAAVASAPLEEVWTDIKRDVRLYKEDADDLEAWFEKRISN